MSDIEKRLQELCSILSEKGFNPEIICEIKFTKGEGYNYFGNKIPTSDSYMDYKIKLNTLCMDCDVDKLKIKFKYSLDDTFEYAYLDIETSYLKDKYFFEMIKERISRFPEQDEERQRLSYNSKILNNLSISLSTQVDPNSYSEINDEQIKKLRTTGYWIDTRS